MITLETPQINLPSFHQPWDLVRLNFFGKILDNCTIKAVRFMEGKVHYNVIIFDNKDAIIDGTNETLIENVDSVFVEKIN